MFMKQLDVDEDVATILAQEGFSTIEELAYVPVCELASIDAFDDDLVQGTAQPRPRRAADAGHRQRREHGEQDALRRPAGGCPA